jgi:5,6-dimethylbenzimidazole synthase
MTKAKMNKLAHRFSEEERRGLYRAIYERRDVRSLFIPDEITADVLARLLDAAHHAPSVGFMQPWRFIVIRDRQVRQTIHEIFDRARHAAAQIYTDDRRAMYDTLKLAGILEAPINLCVVCDEETGRGHGLGRQTMPETALYSAVCAVQNLWLAARAEGVGVGWVSILGVDELRRALGIPEGVVPVAYLCLGYVTEFGAQPELEITRWEQRASLADLIHFERYGGTDEARAGELLRSLNLKKESEINFEGFVVDGVTTNR